MSRFPSSLIVPLVATAAALLLAACGSGTPTGTAAAGQGAAGQGAGGSAQTAGLPGEHVHGIARNPGDGKVYLATHHGLFRYDKGTAVQVGPQVDLMGFAVAGPGRFYSSGHPADGVDLPAPVGLMESVDAGRTWSVQSLGGKSDFHALTSSSKGVVGYDGTLQSSTDGKTWQPQAIAAEPTSLAAAPDGSRILATTASGVLVSSDQGATWAPLTTAPQLLAASWADSSTAVGVTQTGALAITTDAGANWKTSTGKVDSMEAISASRVSGGTLEVLVVTNTAVERSLDSGASFSPLGTS